MRPASNHSTRTYDRYFENTSDRNSQPNADVAVTGSFRLTESLRGQTTIGIGVLASERFTWRETGFLGVGVRHDRWTHDGFAPSTFLSADAAWVIIRK